MIQIDEGDIICVVISWLSISKMSDMRRCRRRQGVLLPRHSCISKKHFSFFLDISFFHGSFRPVSFSTALIILP